MRLIDEYDLGPAFGDELETPWTSDGGNRLSLRALADLFNRALLDAAMNESGMSSIDGDVENPYRLLSDDEVSSGMRTEAPARLDRKGVDINVLYEDCGAQYGVFNLLNRGGCDCEPTETTTVE